MSGWKPVERAYSSWLRAAREERGNAAALGRALERYLRKTYRLGPDDNLRDLGVETQLTGRTIARWEKGTVEKPQPQYPADPWSREALQAVVTELVPAPPTGMEWESFHDVCEAFAADRLERIERGAGNLESHAATQRNNERHQFLSTWPAPAAKIDPITLGLGSWAFEGALPPYVTRTTDTELAQRLDHPGITTVTGAPKSGKSRSILQILQREHPQALTWWVNPSPTMLPLLVEAAKKAKGKERPDVIVLDDAGLIGTDPTAGLTAQRLHDLAGACTHLIIVIHTQTIADWEYQLTHRTTGFDTSSLGASQELINQLHQRVTYDSVLDDEETGPAAHTYDTANERVKAFDLTRLAETLAGVETLKKQATHILETPTSIEAALLEAAIDASIAFPSGTTPDILQTLATAHHKRRQPNRPWRPERFDDALDTLTTGITTGSPHAILTTTDHTTYRLLDALTPELQHPDRDITGALDTLMSANLSMEVLDSAVSGVVDFARRGSLKRAREIQLRAALKGHTGSMHAAAVYAEMSGDLNAARSWLERAAALGDIDAMYARGDLARDAGEDDEGRDWWGRAADAGHAGAMDRLGFSWEEFQKAQPLWEREAERGDRTAMYNLGVVANHDGHTDAARAWWEKAAQKGHPWAMLSLGRLADGEGDAPSARRWWEKAAVIGVVDALLELGSLAWREGQTASAEEWWKKGAAYKDADAMFNLGVLAHESGDLPSACAWWEDAFTHGCRDAALALAEAHETMGNLAEAAKWRTVIADSDV